MSTYPPDKWVTSGTWNTDHLLDTTVFATGDAALRAEPTLVVKGMYSGFSPTAGGQEWYGSGLIRADSNGALDIVGLYLQWYTEAYAYIDAGTIFQDHVTAVDTWELKEGIVTAHANARWMRFFFWTADTGLTAWLDSIVVDESKRNAHVSPSAGIVGTKLTHGAGVLAHLEAGGTLDNLTSVSTRAITSLTGQATAGQIANQVIDEQHVYQRRIVAINPNPNLLRYR